MRCLRELGILATLPSRLLGKQGSSPGPEVDGRLGGDVLGHKTMGVVTEVGADIANLAPGDRVHQGRSPAVRRQGGSAHLRLAAFDMPVPSWRRRPG
jgi:hypothetical protein